MGIAGRRIARWAFLASVCLPLVGRGDGCLMEMGGAYVSETHQQAFIEWIGNRERLYLATRAQAHDGPVLWIVPVPGDPTEVDAEPMKTIPVIADANDLVESAQHVCWNTLRATFLLDTGFLLPFAIGRSSPGMRASATFSAVGAALPDAGVTVYQHVEKLGMVLEVLTAQSTAALDGYLNDQKVGVRADQIEAIAPYLAQRFTLVCAWTTGKPVEARSMRIDFPTPTLYYPLLPTRVYQDRIATQINVRGFVQSTGDAGKMGVRCRYLSGRKVDRNLAWLSPMERGWNGDSAFIVPSSALDRAAPEGFTQVEVHARPSTWSSDLYFEPGAPAAVWTANWIQGHGVLFWFLTAFGTGILTAGFLPFVVARAEPAGSDAPQPAPSAPARLRPDDFLWAAMVGGMIVGSIFLAGATYCCWLHDRKHVGRGFSLKARRTTLFIVLLVLLGLLIFVPSSYSFLSFMVIFLGLAGIFLFLCFDLALRFTRGKLRWLMLFALAHFGAVAIICASLATWLAFY